jgi:hypothetical protein
MSKTSLISQELTTFVHSDADGRWMCWCWCESFTVGLCFRLSYLFFWSRYCFLHLLFYSLADRQDSSHFFSQDVLISMSVVLYFCVVASK